jgi:RimJ/RimL family protein N-acetyltransferase
MEKIKSEASTKRFIIEYDGMPVGTVIISDINVSSLTANINIKLKSSARGKGIGKQSICLGLKYCFEGLGLFCVTAHILPYNTASIALFERCGFTKEGVMRSRVVKQGKRFDLLSYSILTDEFKKSMCRG